VTAPPDVPDSEAPEASEVPQPIAPEVRRRSLIVLGCVAVAVVVLDQLTKHWVVSTIQPRIESGEGPLVFLGGFLKLTYTENTGAAFSMGSSYTWIFSTVAVVVAVVILRSARRLGSIGWAIALGGLLGGLLGNLIDRVTRPPGPGLGYVVDWIQLPNFAVFNVADMCITGSAALMVLLALRGIDFSGSHRP
jgi:signal peptidase II